jgi:predicted transcriptional regulator
MSVISLRLPDDLEAKLAQEAERAHKPRSEIARVAIADYLARRERDRFLAEIARAARARGTVDPIEIAEQALPLDNEALALAEGHEAREPKTTYRARRAKRK